MNSNKDYEPTPEEKAALDTSLATFNLEGDRPEYKYVTKVQPPVKAAESVIKQLSKIDGLDENARTMASAMLYANMFKDTRNFTRTTEVTRLDDEERKVNTIKLNMDAETADAIITDMPAHMDAAKNLKAEGDFRKMVFASESEKQKYRYKLLEWAHRRASEVEHPMLEEELAELDRTDPQPNNVARTMKEEMKRVKKINDFRKKQRENLSAAMADSNIALDHKVSVKEVSQRVNNDLVRQTTLTGNYRKELVPAPNLGDKTIVNWQDKKALTTYMGEKPFGTKGCTKSLRQVMNTLSQCIDSNYNAKAATDILLHVMGGAPAKYIESIKESYTFDEMFMHVQISFQPKLDYDSIDEQLANLKYEQPVDANQTIATIVTLCEERTRYMDVKEKRVIRETLEKDHIYTMLREWYPHGFIAISNRYEQITTQGRLQNGTLKSPGAILNQLAREMLRGVKPLSVKQARINSMDTGHYYARRPPRDSLEYEEVTDGLAIHAMNVSGNGGFQHQGGPYRPQQNKFNFNNAQKQYGNDMSKIGAEYGNFNQGGNFNRTQGQRPNQGVGKMQMGDVNRPNQPSQGGGQNLRPRQVLRIPTKFRNRCLKCGELNHVYKNCPTYTSELSQVACLYCTCFHSGKCRNITGNEINEIDFESEEPLIVYDDSEDVGDAQVMGNDTEGLTNLESQQ